MEDLWGAWGSGAWVIARVGSEPFIHLADRSKRAQGQSARPQGLLTGQRGLRADPQGLKDDPRALGAA